MLPLPSFPSDKSDFDRSVVCLVFRSDVNPDSFGGVKTKKVWPEIIFFKAIFSNDQIACKQTFGPIKMK